MARRKTPDSPPAPKKAGGKIPAAEARQRLLDAYARTGSNDLNVLFEAAGIEPGEVAWPKKPQAAVDGPGRQAVEALFKDGIEILNVGIRRFSTVDRGVSEEEALDSANWAWPDRPDSIQWNGNKCFRTFSITWRRKTGTPAAR